MKKYNISLFLLLTMMGLLEAQTGGVLSLEIRGTRSDEGRLIILLFSSKDGFPDSLEKAFRVIPYVRLKGGKAFVVFSDLPPGTYAVVVFHDENGNGEIDRNVLGLPTEGLGLSDNPVLFTTPRFTNADFVYEGGDMTLFIDVLYIYKKKK